LRRLAALLLMLIAAGIALPLIAQESDEAQKSGFLRFIEDRISSPSRRIAINGLEGALSSDLRIAEITISDAEGVWLRIDNAQLNWDQAALLTGRLQINSLTADSIDYIRPAVPPEGVTPPAPEAGAIDVPELPVAVFLEELSVPQVTFGEDLFGLGSEISVAGRLVLEGGSLDTNLDIDRLDGPGGNLSLNLKYDRESTNADIDLALTEPRDGVIVNLLGMEGKPELSLRVQGSGPFTDIDTELTLDADGKRALTGVARLNSTADGLDIDADLNGPIADLVPAAYKPFFGSETRLSANALVRDAGGFTLNTFALTGGQLAIDASANTTTDGFLSSLVLDAQIADRAGQKVALPGGGATTRVSGARLQIDYGQGDSWEGALVIDGLETGELATESISLALDGAALNLNDPATRRVTFNADGTISGITAKDPQVADALGDSMGLGLAGLWSAGDSLQLAEARLRGKAFDMALSGALDGGDFDGNVILSTPSIAPFSGLAGRQLSGALQLSAEGSIALLTGGFDLTLNGNANDLRIGMDALDNILTGETQLSGRVARTEAGVTAEQFRIGNAQSRIAADGTFASDAADFEFSVALSDLALLSENATGALTAVGTAKGADGLINLDFDAQVPSGTLTDRRLRDAVLGFTGQLEGADLNGSITGNTFLDGHRVDLTADVAVSEGTSRLSGLNFTTAGTKLTGGVAQGPDGLLTGALDLQSNDLSVPAALLLAEASGAATAKIELAPRGTKQSATIAASVRDVTYNDIRVSRADITASIGDVFGVPAIKGTLDGTGIAAAGLDIDTLNAAADQNGETTSFSGTATLANGADIDTGGSLTPVGDGYRVVLDRLQLQQGPLSARLASRTALTVANETVTLQDVIFDVGGGRITSSGTAGEALDLAVTVDDVPLAIANAIMPDLGLAGTLNGRLRVSGTASEPSVGFDISGSGISAAMIATYGVTPLQVDASGTFANNTLRLAALQANGPAGSTLSANGTMPLVGSNGDLRVTGTVPLAIANRTVGSRGTQLSGSVNIDARVTGSLAQPSFGGAISTANAEVVDPQSNLRLQSISASARLSGQQLIVESFSGSLATGGSISVSGSMSLNGDLPADIQIGLNSARYADGNMFVATASGQLAVTGSLLRDPLLSGDVRVERAEISIPDSFDTSAVLLEVDHASLPPDVAETLRRLRTDGGSSSGSGRPSVMRLNVAVSAPNQIFVRGRGADAELGGQVQLRGTVNNIQPSGGFELIRGRMNILGQRLDFTSGTVTLVGTLDPYIRLTAQSVAEDATVYIILDGPVSDLDIVLTSQPELPQDEVLSLLIFKRALSDLSPLQLAKLAGAAAELAGGSNNSLVDGLRSAAGLADLDVITDAEGNTAVRAGTYIQDNVYVSVEAGAEGDSKVSIDLDLNENFKARGSTTNDGETSLGIFFEQDY